MTQGHTWKAARERSWLALATARMASTGLPVYFRPALEEMMPGTSPGCAVSRTCMQVREGAGRKSRLR